MSDRYGFDFNNDGKVSFEESHLTYHIERETARKNSGNYYPPRNQTSKVTSNDKNSDNKSKGGNWIIYLILGARMDSFLYREGYGYPIII